MEKKKQEKGCNRRREGRSVHSWGKAQLIMKRLRKSGSTCNYEKGFFFRCHNGGI